MKMTTGKYIAVKYKSLSVGADDYASNIYRVDQLYRKYIRYFRKANQNRILADLTEKIEKVYTNEWLLNYSNHWQSVIDEITEWNASYAKAQKNFFKTQVQPTLDKKQRLFVIITDALRYECGQELTHKLQQENRYDAKLNYLISGLPSYISCSAYIKYKGIDFFFFSTFKALFYIMQT